MTSVRRIRKIAPLSPAKPEAESAQFGLQGFGSVPNETEEEFHDRMFEIPAHEAMLYELDFAIRQKQS